MKVLFGFMLLCFVAAPWLARQQPHVRVGVTLLAAFVVCVMYFVLRML